MIIDVIDYSSPAATASSPTIDHGMDRWTRQDILRDSPHSVIIIIRPADSLIDTLDRIISVVPREGALRLLRMHGHGYAGNFLHGTMTEASIENERDQLVRLRPCFRRGAQALLFGCWVGQRPAMLRDLAEAWQVPVTAGIRQQLTGGDYTLTFEGRTVTGLPNGRVQFDRARVPRVAHPFPPPTGPQRVQ